MTPLALRSLGVFAVIATAFMAVALGLSRLASDVMNEQLSLSVELTAEVIHESRRLYSDEVVDRLRGVSGVVVSNRYTDHPVSMPNPATFTILLGERLSRDGRLIRMYSDLPFAHRTNGAPDDDFALAAIAQARSDPSRPYIRKEQHDGRWVMRYAGAMVMERSCIGCHNAHPDSPRKDWQVGDVRGVLEVTQPYGQDGRALASIMLTRTALAALAVALLIGILHYVWSLRVQAREASRATATLRIEAETDALTGLANRRAFEADLAAALGGDAPVSLILVDVDRFKQYNDTLGHQAGDECLKAVATALGSARRRPDDRVTRYGGEEFAMVLPGAGPRAARRVAEGMIEAVRALELPHPDGVGAHVTISAGHASFVTASAATSGAQLIERADAALYRAKAEGRDRSVGHADEPASAESAGACD